MIDIFIQNINDISINEINISSLSPFRREKYQRLKDGKSKRQSLAAGLMLNKYISDKEIKLNQYGKPYVESGVFFNLAHSGDYVILVTSDKREVGCDIEQLRDCDYERMGRVVYTEGEMEKLINARNKQEKFFEYWTKKEAFIKCLGEGFHFPVKSLDLSDEKPYVNYKGEKLFFKEYMLTGYKIMICSADNDTNF